MKQLLAGDTQSLCNLTLGHRDGRRAVEFGPVSAMLGCQLSRAKAIQQGSVGGAGAWLGHAQQMSADNKCTALCNTHTWFTKHVSFLHRKEVQA
jgi:hypothetical protein